MYVKQFVSLYVAVALLLSACAPVAVPLPAVPEQDGTQQEEPVQTPTEAGDLSGSPEAETVAMVIRQMLMQQLQANFDTVEVVSVEAREWPNGCLGLPAETENCMEAIVPGYRVTLAVNGAEYVYRADAEANNIRLEEAPAPQIGELVIQWKSNEEDGVCTVAEIGTGGVAWGICGNALMQGFLANPERQQELAEFAGTYAPFEAVTPAGQATFQGSGEREATPAQQRMIAEWARLAYQEAAAGRSGASWGLAFAWHREGGIAGFCDDLTVYITGQVFASTCAGNGPETLADTRLDAEQLAQLYEWVDTFQNFEYERTDPATADAMTIRMVFSGAGEEQPSETQQQAILDFAAQLYAELTSTETPHVVFCAECGRHNLLLRTGEVAQLDLPEVRGGVFYDHAPTTNQILYASIFPDHGMGPGNLSVSDLYLFDLDSDTTTAIIPEEVVVRAVWAPDGVHFVYLRATEETYELRWRSLDGDDRLLATNVTPTFSVSPSGEEVAFTRESNYNLDITPGVFIVDVATGEERRVSSIDKAGRGSAGDRPRWSPDQTYLLMNLQTEETVGLYRIFTDGTSTARLAFDPALSEEIWYEAQQFNPVWLDRTHFLGTPFVQTENAALGGEPLVVLYELNDDLDTIVAGTQIAEGNLVGWNVPGESVWIQTGEGVEVVPLP